MKKIFFPFLFGLILFALSSGFVHPFYLSVSQIKYNTEASSLEIACKIFVDDLEKVLKDEGAGVLHLGLEKEAENADEYVANYLKDHLKIVVNGKVLEGNFLGKEVTDDVIWSYIEILDVEYPSEFSIDNTLLTESLDGQQNIVHVNINGKEKSLRLFKGKTKEVLNF